MKTLFATAILIFLSQSSLLALSTFSAAAFKVDITPSSGIDMWGYSARQGQSIGVLDPLYAKGVLLSDGETRIALITLDLGRTFSLVSMELVREIAQREGDIDMVLFFASHTHSGPSILDHGSREKIPEWEREMLKKISWAIIQATHNLLPATLGSGSGEALLGHNRIRSQPDGSVKMFWRNATKIPTSPVDDHVGVVRIDDKTGNPIAILVNYSCHPVVLGPDNLRYSADYPGAMSTVVESAIEGTVCLFFQGAPGDINPYFDKTPLRENGVQLMQETGHQLGEVVVRVARAIRMSSPITPSLQYSLETIPFNLRWNKKLVLSTENGRKTASRYAMFSKDLNLPVTTLLINQTIILTGMPGEPFVDFAIQSRQRFPAKTIFFTGYANGHFGYFPTLEGAVKGGYGGNSLGAWIEVGAGERMLDRSLINVHEMLGNLKKEPGE